MVVTPGYASSHGFHGIVRGPVVSSGYEATICEGCCSVFPIDCRVIPGSCLWIDLTHWYFAVYMNPYRHINDFIAWRRAQWHARLVQCELHIGLQRGPWPKCSIASLLGLSFELVSARTLQPEMQQRITAPLESLWEACDFTGPIHFRGCDSQIQVDAGSAELHAVLLPVLAEGLHCHVQYILDSWNFHSLLAVALACARCATLRADNSEAYLEAAARIGKAAVGIIEHTFIKEATRLCRADLPPGAQERFTYKSGNTCTRKDPRLQVSFHFQL